MGISFYIRWLERAVGENECLFEYHEHMSAFVELDVADLLPQGG